MLVFEDYEQAPVYDVPDPAAIRSRIELSNSWVGVDLIVLARREMRTLPCARWPLQSDYASRWAESGAVPPPEPQALPRTTVQRRLIDATKQRWPALVGWKHKLLYRIPALSRSWRRHRSVAYHKQHSFEAQPDRFLQASPRPPAAPPSNGRRS